MTFCKGVSPWFLSKNRPFSYMFFFLSKKSQKQTVFDILDTKECILDLKSEVLIKSRKSTFWKGVSPWSFSKNPPFSYMFFFWARKARNKQFLIFGIRSEVLKKSRKSTFCKGVSPWFLSKKTTFLLYFFLAIKP